MKCGEPRSIHFQEEHIKGKVRYRRDRRGRWRGEYEETIIEKEVWTYYPKKHEPSYNPQRLIFKGDELIGIENLWTGR